MTVCSCKIGLTYTASLRLDVVSYSVPASVSVTRQTFYACLYFKFDTPFTISFVFTIEKYICWLK